MLAASGEYVPVSCTHCPSNQPSLVNVKLFEGELWLRQGRLSRHKVSVGEPADGLPPIIFMNIEK